MDFKTICIQVFFLQMFCLEPIGHIVRKHLRGAFKYPKWHNFLGLLMKDSILMRRNIGFLLFQFLIPVVQLSLFCLCIGREPFDLEFGVVNNETNFNSTNTAGSLFVNELNSHTFTKVNSIVPLILKQLSNAFCY